MILIKYEVIPAASLNLPDPRPLTTLLYISFPKAELYELQRCSYFEAFLLPIKSLLWI